MDTETPTPPVDPNAPTKHTLPSGKVVEVRSHRTLLGADGAAVIAAQTGVGAQGVVDMHNALIARMVTEIESGKSGAPALDGTIGAVTAQRIDDWRVLYGLVFDAYKLITGESVVPDWSTEEQMADPTAPTRGSSDSRSPSEVDDPS